MKLIRKSQLVLVDGYPVDTTTNELVPLDAVAAEANELVEMRQLVEFLEANRTQIETSKDKLVYKQPKAETPKMKLGKTADTPLLDQEKKLAEARAAEFLDVQLYSDIDKHLERYVALADWFSRDYVICEDTHYTPMRFVEDIFAISQDDVVRIVERYHDPEIVKLRNSVVIEF